MGGTGLLLGSWGFAYPLASEVYVCFGRDERRRLLSPLADHEIRAVGVLLAVFGVENAE